MNNELYYTPELSEICVGLEFEVRDISTSQWIGFIFDHDWSYEDMDIVDWIDFDIRVKHLDRKDIESLGFEFYKTGWTDTSLVFRNNHDAGVEIYFREDYTLHVTRGRGVVLFAGKIKNKSELSRLMGWLGIKAESDGK